MPMAPRPYNLMSAIRQQDYGSNPLVDELGGSQEPFYSPETGMSQNGWAYLGDIGAGLLANSGWVEGPAPGFGQGLGQGLQNANANHSDRLRAQMSARLQGYELKRQQRQDAIAEKDRAAQEAQQAQMAEMVAKMPPEIQAAYRMNPEAVGKRIVEMTMPEAAKPSSNLAQLAADRDAGYITPAQYDAAVAKETYIAPQAPRSINTVPVIDPKTGQVILVDENQSQGMQPAPTGGGDDPPVAVMKDGKIVYVRRSESYGLQPAPTSPLVQVGAGGKAPEGYRWTDPTQTQLEPIAGGPKDPNTASAITTDQRNKLSSARQAHGNIVAGMSRLEGLVTESPAIGAGGATLFKSDQNAKLQSVHTSILMEMKNLMELGVLNGNDEALITRMVPDPTSWESMVQDPLIGLKEARRYIDTKLQQAESSLGGGRAQAPAPGGNLYDGVPGAAPLPSAATPTLPSTGDSAVDDAWRQEFGD